MLPLPRWRRFSFRGERPEPAAPEPEQEQESEREAAEGGAEPCKSCEEDRMGEENRMGEPTAPEQEQEPESRGLRPRSDGPQTACDEDRPQSEQEHEREVAEGGAERRCAAREEERTGGVRAGLRDGRGRTAGGEAGRRRHGSRVTSSASRARSACWWLAGRERHVAWAASRSSLKRSAATRLMGEPSCLAPPPPNMKSDPKTARLWWETEDRETRGQEDKRPKARRSTSFVCVCRFGGTGRRGGRKPKLSLVFVCVVT